MQKTSPEQIAAIKSFLRENASTVEKTIEQMRAESLAMAMNIPLLEGTKLESTLIGGLNGEWVISDTVPKDSKSVVLYFHGGGFTTGSCITNRDIAARISKASGVRVLNIDYRLAPENKYPSANEDCLKAYSALIESGIPADNIILGGDSAGGYLVLMTLLSLKKSDMPIPRAAFLLSPHTDFLYYDGESYITRAEMDPTNSLEGAKMFAAQYFDTSVKAPSILSPLNEDLHGLPDLFIQTGDHEVILSDSTRLVEKATEAGVKAEIEVWENMWHIFRFMAYMLPEGQEAINNIGAFIKRKIV